MRAGWKTKNPILFKVDASSRDKILYLPRLKPKRRTEKIGKISFLKISSIRKILLDKIRWHRKQ
jgi:hypothetical protein